jgi:hypothetical protein
MSGSLSLSASLDTSASVSNFNRMGFCVVTVGNYCVPALRFHFSLSIDPLAAPAFVAVAERAGTD